MTRFHLALLLAIPFLVSIFRPMRVPGNDNVESGYAWNELKLVQIMQHIEYPAAEYDKLGVGIVLCPLARVYVSFYSCGRGDPSQSFNHFRSADIPGMDDVVRPRELLYRRGAE